MKYLFCDLDDTLCESKQRCSPEMIAELKRISKKYNLIIISGGQFSRMFLQAPIQNVLFMPQNGNEIYKSIDRLKKNKLGGRTAINAHIEVIAKELGIVIGEDMVEDRGSQISFSPIGHNAPIEIKRRFDPDRKVRIALLKKFPFKRAVIGGTTCIDYVAHTKGENIAYFLNRNLIDPKECLYVGDSFCELGNDETVRGIIPVLEVKNPIETLNFLKTI